MDEDVSYGVLVGWAHDAYNGRFDLKLQSARKLRDSQPESIQSHHFIMTPNQALLLGNFLLGISGQQAPVRRKRGWLARLFGI